MKRVLVIEDNLDNLELMRCVLERSGYEVIAAVSGEEGVALAESQRPAFILMDINLPGIDGLEATRRIRASSIDGSTPIIAITSYAMRGDMERVMDAGCNGYFEKPIDPLRIMDDIHAILRRMANEDIGG
ncbi:MAG: response regulator [Desulfobulbaceae bacterium]|nr:response regulator [Desulfobulbaceae bacterium]